MEPSGGAVPATPAVPRVSSLALVGIAGIALVVIAGIFGYILFVSGMRFDSQLWWIGFVSFVFAAAFYFTQAGVQNRTIPRSLAGAFFVIGAGSFYASLATNPDAPLVKLLWMVVLSVFLVAVLVGMYWHARSEERDAARKAQRRVTP